MNWIDNKYILLLSNRLDKFKKRNNVYNFRCPICKDSIKNKTKTRGYLISESDRTRFYCHNCGANKRFSDFLKEMDENLYGQYVIEKIADKKITCEPVDEVKQPINIVNEKNLLTGAKKISQLPLTHPARKYVDDRKIPPRFHYKILFVEKFKAWVNSLLPGKFESTDIDESRIVFLMYDEKKTIFGLSARAMGESKAKYITIIFNDEVPKVFGLESINPEKDIFVFEGPIDSMMISNALATCGGVLTAEIKQLDIPKDKFVLVFDNEPRHTHTCKFISKAINAGFRVVIFPPEIDKKDANDMIRGGMTPLEYKNILKRNTFSGLEALLRFNEWKKI